MKQVAFATIACLAAAADSDSARFRLQKFAPHQFSNQYVAKTDADFERQYPEFASPLNAGLTRKHVEPEIREGDELILKKDRQAAKAVRDEKLGDTPKTEPFHMNPKDRVPIEPKDRVFQAPVFLVDPMFTKDKKDEEIVVFRDNDWAGWKQPRVLSHFPIVKKEVQDFFSVKEDCSCRKVKALQFKEPSYLPLKLPQYYAPVLEPQYVDKEGKIIPGANQHTCFRGDDYGGHNIPYPHPAPPKPDPYYDQDSFIDLSVVYGSKQAVEEKPVKEAEPKKEHDIQLNLDEKTGVVHYGQLLDAISYKEPVAAKPVLHAKPVHAARPIHGYRRDIPQRRFEARAYRAAPIQQRSYGVIEHQPVKQPVSSYYARRTAPVAEKPVFPEQRRYW